MSPPPGSPRVASTSGDTDLLRRKAAFIQHVLPGLSDGRYEIEVQQSLLENAQDGGADVTGGLPPLTRRFGVAGLRYSLPRTAVHAVFPPENTEGAFSDSLPHVVLASEQVPWQRSPYTPANEPAVGLHSYEAVVNGVQTTIEYEDDVPSWLATLLLTPSDLGQVDPLSLLREGTVLDLVPDALQGGDGEAAVAAGALPSNGYGQFSHLLGSGGSVQLVDPGIGQSIRDRMQYIDLPCAAFDAIAPSIDDLRMMAHVREVEMDAKALSAGETAAARERYALVLGNRLPESFAPNATTQHADPVAAPGANVGLLVSMESMQYALRGHAAGGGYDAVAKRSNGFVRLVVMYAWRFTSRDDTTFAFETLLEALNGRGATGPVANPDLRQPAPPTYTSPTPTQAVVEDMLAAGFLPFEHHTRVAGEPLTQNAPAPPVRTVSWYRGPFVPPGASTTALESDSNASAQDADLLAYSADQLLRFDPAVGMYDVSYAAAWQLGRMISLQSKDFSVALYRWKRQGAVRYRVAVEREALRAWYGPALARGEHDADAGRVAGKDLQRTLLRHLGTVAAQRSATPEPASTVPGDAPAPTADAAHPASLIEWLAALRNLHGVPFTSLVSDERLLPPESLKLFQIDKAWIQALEDGALSIGRNYTASTTPSPTLVHERAQRPRLSSSVAAAVPELRRRQFNRQGPTDADITGPTTGFLLRSKVVSGWKGMDVLGYAAGHSPHELQEGTITADAVQAMALLRLERLSPTVMIGLFAGTLYELVLHQPPEGLHFGLLTVDYAHNQVAKNLRVPTPGWDDPDTAYDSQTYADRVLDSAFAGTAARVLDLHGLSRSLAAALDAVQHAPGYFQHTPDDAHQGHLLSSDFALEMVQGVGLVSFIDDRAR